MSYKYQYFHNFVILKIEGEEKYFGLEEPSPNLIEKKETILNLVMTPKLNNIALVCEYINNRSFDSYGFNFSRTDIDPKIKEAAILYLKNLIDTKINHLFNKIYKMKEYKKTFSTEESCKK